MKEVVSESIESLPKFSEHPSCNLKLKTETGPAGISVPTNVVIYTHQVNPRFRKKAKALERSTTTIDSPHFGSAAACRLFSYMQSALVFERCPGFVNLGSSLSHQTEQNLTAGEIVNLSAEPRVLPPIQKRS